MDERNSQLCQLTRRSIGLPTGEIKIHESKKWNTPAQQFYKEHLYSTFFGSEFNDEIERKLFGPIDQNGSTAVRAFLSDDQALWHHNFSDLFTYLDAQKLRTPKGLDWIKSNYPELSQIQLMAEMQSLRTIHRTLWSEGVRELVSAEESEVKFILSDHPVTVYNYACPPDSEFCNYPNDPDISLKGSQTIFPLDKNRCLILTNLEYAQAPESANPLEQRTNATRIRQSMVNTIEFINSRKLNADEVSKVNFIIKNRARKSVAAGRAEWLYPENDVACDWAELRHTLLPPSLELYRYGGEMFAGFADGTTHYQDAFGRTTPQSDFLIKNVDETKLGRNDFCGCGSGRKYKSCCQGVRADLRTSWDVLSIRERNLAFCSCITHELGLDNGKSWLDVRKELSDDQIKRIYEFYAVLWPRETDIYALLPKSDGKFRGLYTGALDVRVIGINALPIAALFDEYLIDSPIVNPNIVRPEFSPVESPSKYKYQALKDFLFMLQMEPFIRRGLINLIPDPCDFDLPLLKAMMEMAIVRSKKNENLCEQDKRLYFRLAIEDILNSSSMAPRNSRIKLLVSELGLDEAAAIQTIEELEKKAEASALVMLQPPDDKNSGQFLQFSMGPNYEMSLFIAQISGSVLITDSGSRWQELLAAQHRNQGLVFYPWKDIFSQVRALPIDESFVETYSKSQSYFSTLRDLLKSADRLVLQNIRNTDDLAQLTNQFSNLTKQIEHAAEPLRMAHLKVLSPDGGFYDANVQRLLMRSSCLRYDRHVRTVYGIGF